MIYALVQGQESAERLNLLLELTRIGSDEIVRALRQHLTDGMSLKDAPLLNGIKQQNFNRSLKRLNEIAATVEQIKEIDWSRFAASTGA
jgi:hypothetical protein